MFVFEMCGGFVMVGVLIFTFLYGILRFNVVGFAWYVIHHMSKHCYLEFCHS